MIIDAGKENIPAFLNELSKNFSESFDIAIVIPCLNEPGIGDLLHNLSNNVTNSKVYIFIIINSNTNVPSEIINENFKSYNLIRSFISKNSKIKFFPLNILNIPDKIAGAGFARKIGMDLASNIFKKYRKDGIIVSLDADCKVEENYLIEIENTFLRDRNIKTAIIYFEHPIEGNEFPEYIYKAAILYELHLRYHVEKLKEINFPYAYHTIGSCFAIKSSIYIKSGGMNTRKAGEDFYFLNKVFPLGKVIELNTTCVYPSPRISNRVPFGTGPAIKEIIENNHCYNTYHPESYKNLKKLFFSLDLLYTNNINNINILLNSLHESLQAFLIENNFFEKINEIKNNTSNFTNFSKRFFNWFNAFRIIKYLNFAHNNNYYEKLNIIDAVLNFIEKNQINITSKDPCLLLKYLRKRQRKN